DLAALAEKTLSSTDAIAQKAISAAAQRNLGVTVDRLKRADLPRIVRSAAADPQFPPGKGWTSTQATLSAAGADLGHVRVDADPSPSKAARPLALLVDPPRDEPLDHLVHTQATRRLLAARRSAAMVLFEIRRHERASSAEATASLYRELLQRATLASYSDEDAGRWAVEVDGGLRAATQLEGAILAAQLQQALEKTPEPRVAAATPAADPADSAKQPREVHWWHEPGTGA